MSYRSKGSYDEQVSSSSGSKNDRYRSDDSSSQSSLTDSPSKRHHYDHHDERYSRSQDDKRSGEKRRRSRSPHDKRSHHRSSHYHRRDSRDEYEGRSSSRRHHRRSRSRSISPTQESRRDRCRLEMQKQMAKNYEEQLEKMKNAAALEKPGLVPLKGLVQPSALKEQVERRKMLWNKGKEKAPEAVVSTSVWNGTKFTGDEDGKVSAKFKRLMGMKETPSSCSSQEDDNAEKVPKFRDSPTVQHQQKYFEDLEKQYEVARATTHTQRGLGLGFSSATRTAPATTPASEVKQRSTQ